MFLARVKTRGVGRLLPSRPYRSKAASTSAAHRSRGRAGTCWPAFRSTLETISGHVNREFQGLSQAMAETGGFYPRLVHELVDVGEQTGHLNDIFARLARHYEDQIRLRRSFLGAISWPLLQLVMSILVIGFLIWIMGTIGSGTIDPLGWGLVGNRGLLIYTEIVVGMALAVFLIVQGIRYGLVWTRPVQHSLAQGCRAWDRPWKRCPWACMSWLLHSTMNAGMEIRRAQDERARFRQRSPRDDGDIDRTIALRRPGSARGVPGSQVFPPEFLDAVQVGEESGRLKPNRWPSSPGSTASEPMAMIVITRIAGYAVWLTIALIIVLLIFRLAGFYLGQIQAAGAPL